MKKRKSTSNYKSKSVWESSTSTCGWSGKKKYPKHKSQKKKICNRYHPKQADFALIPNGLESECGEISILMREEKKINDRISFYATRKSVEHVRAVALHILNPGTARQKCSDGKFAQMKIFSHFYVQLMFQTCAIPSSSSTRLHVSCKKKKVWNIFESTCVLFQVKLSWTKPVRRRRRVQRVECGTAINHKNMITFLSLTQSPKAFLFMFFACNLNRRSLFLFRKF